MMHTDTHPPTRVPAGKLLAGIALLAVGILAFIDAIDLLSLRDVWRFWPVILIVIGAGHELDAWRTRRGGGGFVLIGIGVWMLAGSLELFGLDYRSAFPLAIVVVGLGMIVHAALGVEKEKKNDAAH